MRIELLGKDYANVSFGGDARVSLKTEDGQSNNEYEVKWFRRKTTKAEYDQIGTMKLQIDRWGMHNYEDIEQWQIEFWNNEKMVCMYDNDLANKNVILVAKTNPSKVGKGVDFESIKKYCTNKVNEFDCNLKVYFSESCSFDFSSLNFKPLRMNDEIKEMHYGLEKEF